ncbi:hypothetical protein PINS_up010676 [Pythium insidiosum]|nr:hypothetical protein PINS_up010676 [Pythium insidiosum]
MGNDASRPLGADGLAASPGAGAGAGLAPPTPSSMPRTPSLRASRSLSSSASEPRVDKTIQRMDKAIRKRVRGGITYNMKIIIRGDRGTGKTSLFHRLKGEPIPVEHAATPQLQSATINWSYRANSEESVKCEVWDVVDRGFHPGQHDPQGSTASENENPFERGALVGSNLVAAAPGPAAATTTMNGAHVVATVDASTVDVYHETHGVVFLLDVTKPHTLEYVRQHLEKVPVHIPTLVLGNFRDCGAHRKIFKEDIQDLLYGPRSTSGATPRRPTELLYFECSLLNCYGLKALHQYFGVPFLQLKLHTLRQQMRIVEGEFSHLKLDIQGKIAEQRYADYVEHIKATGSDIRTGRRVSGGVNGGAESPRATAPRMERAQSSSSDVVLSPSTETNDTDAVPPLCALENKERQDLENQDLPERRTAEKLLEQSSSARQLKIEYTQEDHARSQPVVSAPTLDVDADSAARKTKEQDESNAEKATKQKQRAPKQSAPVPTPPAAPASPRRKRSIDDVMNLEDFQVPKSRVDDLDNFYSEDESDADEQTPSRGAARATHDTDDEEDDDDEEEETRGAVQRPIDASRKKKKTKKDADEDVVVAPLLMTSRAMSGRFHKQAFLDSDSDNDSSEQHQRSTQRRRVSPRQRVATKKAEPTASASGVSTEASVPTPPPQQRPESPVSTSAVPRPPVPPPVPSPTSVSPRRLNVPSPSTTTVMSAVETDSRDDEENAETTPVVDVSETKHEAEETGESGKDAEAKEETQPVDLPPSPMVQESTVDAEEVVLKSTDVEDTATVEKHETQSNTQVNEIEPAVDDAQEEEEEKEAVDDVEDDDVLAAIEADTDALKDFLSSDEDEDANDEELNEEKVVEMATPNDIDAQPTAETSFDERTEELSTAVETIHMPLKMEEDTAVTVENGELTDDDDSKSTAAEDVTIIEQLKPSQSTERAVVMDSEDDSDKDDLSPVKTLHQAAPPVEQSPPFVPSAPTSGQLGDLDAFFGDSDSDSGPTAAPVPVRTAFNSQISDEDDEEDDEESSRFTAYDAQRPRRSRSMRRQQRDELKMMSNSLDTVTTERNANSAQATATTTGNSVMSQDVLAAIRQAQQDALRLLGDSSGANASSPPLTTASSNKEDQQEDSKPKKKRRDKSKSSSSSSSRRSGKSSSSKASKSKRRHEILETDESDG